MAFQSICGIVINENSFFCALKDTLRINNLFELARAWRS